MKNARCWGLNIPHGSDDILHMYHEIRHGTEHHSPYSRYPPSVLKYSPCGTEHRHGTEHHSPYSRYPPSVLKYSPCGTEHPHGADHILYGVKKDDKLFLQTNKVVPYHCPISNSFWFQFCIGCFFETLCIWTMWGHHTVKTCAPRTETFCLKVTRAKCFTLLPENQERLKCVRHELC